MTGPMPETVLNNVAGTGIFLLLCKTLENKLAAITLQNLKQIGLISKIVVRKMLKVV